MEALVDVRPSSWSLVDGAGSAPAIECGPMRVGLSPALHFGLRALIAAAGARARVPELQDFVEPTALVEPASGVEPHAVVRGLRAAFCALGLADMVIAHERFGYRLRYPAGPRH